MADARNQFRIAAMSGQTGNSDVRSHPKATPTGSMKVRSLSLTAVPPLPSVCITPSPEEVTVVGGSSEKSGNQPASNKAGSETPEKKLTARQRPRLSIPHIFHHHSSGTSPLTSTPSISSLFTAAAARNFSFSIPHSMRRGSWSVSLSSTRTNIIIAWVARLLIFSYPFAHPVHTHTNASRAATCLGTCHLNDYV